MKKILLKNYWQFLKTVMKKNNMKKYLLILSLSFIGCAGHLVEIPNDSDNRNIKISGYENEYKENNNLIGAGWKNEF